MCLTRTTKIDVLHVIPFHTPVSIIMKLQNALCNAKHELHMSISSPSLSLYLPPGWICLPMLIATKIPMMKPAPWIFLSSVRRRELLWHCSRAVRATIMRSCLQTATMVGDESCGAFIPQNLIVISRPIYSVLAILYPCVRNHFCGGGKTLKH